MKAAALLTIFVLCVSYGLMFGEQKRIDRSTLISKGPMIAKKIKIVGSSQYLGYLNAALHVTRGGTPASGLLLYLNEVKMNYRGGDFYSIGTPYAYKPVVGNKILIKKETKLTRAGFRPKSILLASYTIDNTIEWVYPTPNQTIDLTGVFGRSVLFRWNYTGRVVNTRVRIKDFDKNIEIFDRSVAAESIAVPVDLFKKGRRYRFDLEPVNPLGKFTMTANTARGSEIKFYYWGHIYFSVQ